MIRCLVGSTVATSVSPPAFASRDEPAKLSPPGVDGAFKKLEAGKPGITGWRTSGGPDQTVTKCIFVALLTASSLLLVPLVGLNARAARSPR